MRSTSFDRGIALAAALCVTAAAPAAAQTAGGGPPVPGRPASDWSFSLGGGAAYVPDYEGSDEYEVVPVSRTVWRLG